MALEVSSYVLFIFPIVLLITTLLTLILLLIIARKSAPLKKGKISFVYRHWKSILISPLAIPFIITITLVFAFLAGVPDSLVPLFYLSYDLYHLLFAVYLGLFFGYVFTSAYLVRGVSAFMLTGLFFITIVLAVAYSISIQTVLISMLNELGDGFAVLIVFDLLPCNICALRRNDKKKPIIMETIHSLELKMHSILKRLKNRVEIDGDLSARAAIETLLNQEGVIGDIIQRVASKIKLIDVPTILLPTDSSTLCYLNTGNFHTFPLNIHHWTLSKHEFEERVKVNRVLYFTLLIFTVLLILYIATEFPFLSLLSTTLLIGLILLSVILSIFDNLLSGTRVDTSFIVSDVLSMFAPLTNMLDDPDINESDYIGIGAQPISPSQIRFTTHIDVNEIDETRIPPSIRKFVRRVKRNAHEVYEEDIYSYYIIVPGIIFLIPTMFFVIFDHSEDNLFIIGARLIHTVGLLVIIVSGVFWLHYRRRYMFFGITRGSLELNLAILSLTERGMTDFGKVIYPTPPPRYSMLHWILNNYLKKTPNKIYRITELKRVTNRLYRIQESAISQNHNDGKVVGAIPLKQFLAFYTLIMSLTLSYVYFVLPSLFILFPLIMLILGTGTFIELRLERERLRETLYEMSSLNLDFDTVNGLLTILDRFFRYPLRVVTYGKYEMLHYVDLVYTTTKGVDLNVGVFIPSTL